MNTQQVNLSSVAVHDYSINIDKNKIDLWQMNLGQIKPPASWNEVSEMANRKVHPEMSSAYVVRTRINIDIKTRERFISDLKKETEFHPTWKSPDIYYQMLAQDKIPKISGKIMKLKTFQTYFEIARKTAITDLNDAIMAMWFLGEKKSTLIAAKLACSKTTVYAAFRKNGVNVKPYRKGKTQNETRMD